jgi:hypothetical protein
LSIFTSCIVTPSSALGITGRNQACLGLCLVWTLIPVMPVASAVTVHLGPLYTRSQGQCSTQIKHSYWCKT